ncbi:MAG: carbohydrate porin [Sphingomonadaceae bacterium]
MLRGFALQGCLCTAGLALVPESVEASEGEDPLTLGASYVTDLFGLIDGGVDPGVDWMGRADLTAELDGSRIGLDGATAVADLMFTQGSAFSGRHVGDAQVVSNVEAPRGLRLLEAWLSVPVGDDGVSLKGGLIDLNTEFDVQDVGAFFINSSHGVGPEFSQSGVNGPSIFPATSIGFMIKAERPGYVLRLGAFDAIAGSRADPRDVVIRFPGQRGALIIAEADVKVAPAVNVQLGLWSYTSRFDALNESSEKLRASRGAYALVEGGIADGLDGWVRIGLADDRVNPIGSYLGGGFTWGREGSRFGVAFAHARLGDGARSTAPLDRAETAIELSYERAIGPHLSIQPDVQYVINPGWEPTRRNALVAGLRFKFAFPGD